jgi:hypothetical protein
MGGGTAAMLTVVLLASLMLPSLCTIVVLAGHSMGGGTAAMLTVMLLSSLMLPSLCYNRCACRTLHGRRNSCHAKSYAALFTDVAILVLQCLCLQDTPWAAEQLPC